MLNTELYHRELTDKYTFELDRTNKEFSLKVYYPFQKGEYILNIVYENLPQVIRFSFESLEEIY